MSQPINNSNNDIPIVQPVEYAGIEFKDFKKKISYTDCFEISLLRFLHSVFITKKNDEYVMDITRMKTFMYQTKECKQIINFFKTNNKIKLESSYYENEGYPIRALWCIFLNKRSFFRYKKEDKYEVCASLHNLFAFFKVFFPKITFDQPNDQDRLNSIFSSLSNENAKFSCELVNKTNIKSSQIFYTNTFTISINNIELYEWLIYQYFENADGKFGSRITGHSDLHFALSFLDSLDDSDCESQDNINDSDSELDYAYESQYSTDNE